MQLIDSFHALRRPEALSRHALAPIDGAVRRVAAGFTALCLGVSACATASAATFTVTSAADAGPGSLRAAMQTAASTPSPPHTIQFALPPDSVIQLGSVLPQANSVAYIIDGSDVPGLVLDAGGADRLFDQGAASPLTLRSITLRNGRADGSGGCVRTSHNTSPIVLEHVRVERCEAVTADASPRGGAILGSGAVFIHHGEFLDNRVETVTGHTAGGAVHAAGQLWIEDSLFDGNLAATGDGNARGGAVSTWARLTVLRSRFLGNAAVHPSTLSFGGAIHVSNDAPSTIRQSLFFDNGGWSGSAIFLSPTDAGATIEVTMSNNTIAGNRGAEAVHLWDADVDMKNNTFWKNHGSQDVAHLRLYGPNTTITAAANNLFAPTANGEPACAGTSLPAGLSGTGANLFPDGSCGFMDDYSVVFTGDMRIRALRATGSLLHDIPVVDLFAGSPAIDGGQPNDVGSGMPYACTSGDARNEERPRDGNADGDAVCDVGALELQHEASLFADDLEPVLLR